MPHATLGRYEVLARLASGGTANIFLAKSRGIAGFHKLVCLKVLRPELAGDPMFLEMFLDEARIAARLRHANCVEVYDLGHAEGIYFLSMEYLLGESLRSLMQLAVRDRPVLRAQHMAFIVAAACDGLHHAHELCDSNGRSYGLVHRDVSPRNIMVTADGYTKVVDFGIAKTSTNRSLTAFGSVKGKPTYMSPEQIKGQKLDRKSDIYSLGIVLFEAITSKRLFGGETIQEIAAQILGNKVPRLRDVDAKAPRELEQICAKALAPDPERRFATAREMASALREFLEKAWPSQGTTELARTLDEYLGDELRRRLRACDLLLEETEEETELIRVLGAEPVSDKDLEPPHVPSPPRAISNDTVATEIDIVRESSSGSDSTEIQEGSHDPTNVMPAWARVPSLKIAVTDPLPHVHPVPDKTNSLIDLVTEREQDAIDDDDDEDDEDDEDEKTNPEGGRRPAFVWLAVGVLMCIALGVYLLRS